MKNSNFNPKVCVAFSWACFEKERKKREVKSLNILNIWKEETKIRLNLRNPKEAINRRPANSSQSVLVLVKNRSFWKRRTGETFNRKSFLLS